MVELLKALAHPANQSIIHHLQAEPSYARRIAGILGLPEPEVTRRLRALEQLGVLSSHWSYIGKNVKLYELCSTGANVRFAGDGLHVTLEGTQTRERHVVGAWQPRLPIPDMALGREDEELALDDSAVALVQGLAGIGKTTLVARHVQKQDPERVFWHAFRGIESLHWLAHRMAQFLHSLGRDALMDAVEDGAELADKRELMLLALNDPGLTFVFDDVHWIEDDIVRAFITDAINATTDGDLIVISRHAIPHDAGLGHIGSIHLSGLDDKDVQSLMELDGVPVAADVVERLQAAFGGHPMALHLVAVAATELGRSVAEIVGSKPEGDLADYLLREVHSGLSEAQVRLLCAASLFRVDWRLGDLRIVSSKVQEPELMTLRRHHLVQETAAGYRLHDLVRTFFYGLMDDPREMHLRLAEHLLKQEGVEARLDAMHHFLHAGHKDRVLDLLEHNVDLHDLDFVDAGLQLSYMRLLDMFEEEEVPSARTWALMEDERGDLCFQRGDIEAALAHYETAAKHFHAHPEGTEDEDLAWKRSLSLERLGRLDDALATCAAALASAPEGGLARERLEELHTRLKLEHVKA